MKDEKKEELAEIKNSSQKQIVVNALKTKSNVDKKEHKHYTFYEIEPGKKVVFHLDVIKAKNKEATAQNVYWVAQSNDKFKSKEWLPFERVENAKPLHELLNELNQGTIYDKETLEDGSYNEDYHRYTLVNTKYVGLNYCPTNPYENRFEFREKPKGEVYGELKYIGDVPGRGIWLEGINYHPEFGNQGAFIMVVDKPQILSFYVEQRLWKEREVDKMVKEIGVIKINTETVEEELAYGDILDLHLWTHNTFGYTITMDILCEGKSVLDGEYKKIIKRINLDKENPSKDYNLEFLEEQVIDFRWIKKTGHKQATSPQESSIKTYTLKLVLEPNGDHTKDRKTITREVTFNVNYKNEFSTNDIHESIYTAQIAQVHKPPLITQSFETCHYSKLIVKDSINSKEKVVILEEDDDGVLVESGITTTPIYEVVAGSKEKKRIITIEIEGKVSECVNEENHRNNVFDTRKFPVKSISSEIFGTITPVTIKSKTEKKLVFEVLYPYKANNDFDIFRKYIFGSPVNVWIPIQSCRYTRTLLLKIYPEIEWKLKLEVSSEQPEVFSNTNFKDSSRTAIVNKKAIKAGLNKRYKNASVIFGLNLEAIYNDKPNSIITVDYEKKIKSVLQTLVTIKDTMDNITGVTKAKKGMAAKMGGKFFKMPFTFQLDYPAISIEGSWNHKYFGKGIVKRQGSITFGFTPLIRGKGDIDIAALIGLFPLFKPVLTAADLILLTAGVDYYFNLYGFGEINLKGAIHFNKKDNVTLESATTVGIGLELGLKAEVNTKKLTFSNPKDAEPKRAGFELAVKGETSITIAGMAGHDDKGAFIEINAGFDGITAYVTARVQVMEGALGPKDKPIKVIEPKKDIYNDRWYIIEV